MSGWAPPGLADADANTKGQEREETGGRSTKGRHGAPDRQADRHHAFSRDSVRDASDWNTKSCVKDSECGAREQTELEVGEAQVLLDALHQDRQDLPVYEIHHVDRGEEPECVAEVGT